MNRGLAGLLAFATLAVAIAIVVFGGFFGDRQQESGAQRQAVQTEAGGSSESGSDTQDTAENDSDEKPGDEPAAQPAEDMASAGQGDDTASPAVPAFDLLRVEPDGSTVIAGRAAPNSKIDIMSGDTVIASAKAGPTGDFAAVLDDPLKPGDYQLSLRADGSTLSEEIATVSVPADAAGELLAMISRPGEASRIIAQPVAPPGTSSPETAQSAAEMAAKTAGAQQDTAEKPQGDEKADTPVQTETASADMPDNAAPAAQKPASETGAGDQTAAADMAEPQDDDAAAAEPAQAEDVATSVPDLPAGSDALTGEAPAIDTGADGNAVAGENTVAALPDLPKGSSALTGAAPQVDTPEAGAPEVADADTGDATQTTTQDETAKDTASGTAEDGEPAATDVASAATETPDDDTSGLTIRVDAVEIEGDRIFIAGAATSGAAIRVYADSALVGEAIAEGGRFVVEAVFDLAVGDHVIRADLVSRRSGEVLVRAAVPFDRPEGQQVAAVASREKPGAEKDDNMEKETAGASQDGGQAATATAAPDVAASQPAEASSGSDGVTETAEATTDPATGEDKPVEPNVQVTANAPEQAAPSVGTEPVTGNEPTSMAEASDPATMPADQNAPVDAGQKNTPPDAVAAADNNTARDALPETTAKTPSEGAEPEGAQPETPQQVAAQDADSVDKPAGTATDAEPVTADAGTASNAAGTTDTAAAPSSSTASDTGESVAATSTDNASNDTDTAPEVAQDQTTQRTTRPGSGPRIILQSPLTQSDTSVIIRRGDTLWQISRRVYGQGVRYTTIYLANVEQIIDPDVIMPGQIFDVPTSVLENAETLHRERLKSRRK